LIESLVKVSEQAQLWAFVCDKLQLDSASRQAVRLLIRTTMEELQITDIADPALAANWRQKRMLAISYGAIKALNLERRFRPAAFELWLPVKKQDVDVFQHRRPKTIDPPDPEPDGDWKKAGLIQISILLDQSPSLTENETLAWRKGLRAAQGDRSLQRCRPASRRGDPSDIA
jgi:hypothetical protein